MTDDHTDVSAEEGRMRLFGDLEAAADAFEQLPVMLVVTDGPELRTVAYNAQARAAVQDRFLHGTPILEGFARELGGQGFAEMYATPTKTGRTVSLNDFRVQLHQPDGSVHEIYFDVVASPRLDSEGRPRGTILLTTDVTQRVLDRRAAESELEALREKYAEARGSVRAMQRALLADTVPVSPSFDVAARYVLAADEEVAGGDWFDAVARDDGSIVLAVGDVVGHGRAAAVAMGQLRSVLLSQLRAGTGIGEALSFLDGFAAGIPHAARATVCVVGISASGELEYCTAGHPPPLVLSAGDAESRYLPPSGGGPLVTGSVFVTARSRLDVGEAVVLYSDGILERPGVSPAAASLELLTTTGNAQRNLVLPAGAPASAAERIATLTIELLTRMTGHSDDITILAAQRRAPAPALEVELAVAYDAPVRARIALRAWLENIGPRDDDVEVLLHAVTELVVNVVDHAHLDPEDRALRLHAQLGGDGRVTLDVVDDGTWKLPIITGQRGRGLALVRELVDELEIARSNDGTTARVRHLLTRTAGLFSGVVSHAERDPEHFDVWAEGGPEPVLTVRGPLDATTSTEVAAHLNLALTEAATDVTVDLTLVSLLASAGVDTLFGLTERARALGLRMTLIAPNGTPAQHVLGLVGLPHRVDPL